MSTPESKKVVEQKKPVTKAPIYTKQGYVGMHSVKDKLPFKMGDRLQIVVDGSKVIITKAK